MPHAATRLHRAATHAMGAPHSPRPPPRSTPVGSLKLRMTTTTVPDVAVAGKRRQNLILAALGVVFGDIGTSPLYTVRQAFADYGHVSEPVVFGILSLIAW